jgi:hypothetical protein
MCYIFHIKNVSIRTGTDIHTSSRTPFPEFEVRYSGQIAAGDEEYPGQQGITDARRGYKGSVHHCAAAYCYQGAHDQLGCE